MNTSRGFIVLGVIFLIVFVSGQFSWVSDSTERITLNAGDNTLNFIYGDIITFANTEVELVSIDPFSITIIEPENISGELDANFSEGQYRITIQAGLPATYQVHGEVGAILTAELPTQFVVTHHSEAASAVCRGAFLLFGLLFVVGPWSTAFPKREKAKRH